MSRLALTRTTFVGIAALLAVSAAACSAPVDASSNAAACNEQVTIGFSHPIGEAGVVKSIKKGLEQEAAERGCIEMLFDSTQANNLETQRAAIETWITQGVDAIVVSPVDVEALSGLQQQAQDAGIKWIAYGIPVPGADGMAGFDSVTSGELVGEAAVAWATENHPDGDVSAAVTTLVVLKDTAGRWEGPLDALDAADIPVVSEQDCADQACGLEITEAMLKQNPDLRIFVGFNDDAALGAITAFRNAGIPLDEVFVAGQDGSEEALQSVKEGAMSITAAILQADLVAAILDASLNAISGSGETELLAATAPATLDDPALIDELIAQYK